MHSSVRRFFEFCGVLGIVAALLFAFGRETSTARPVEGLWFDTTDREAVIGAFTDEFGSDGPSLSWVGNHSDCQSGTNSAEHRTSTLRRVNFYRSMAGVPATVSEDLIYSDKAQDAAMMMSAEGELTHTPGGDFACFSDTGQEAAANSNLYLGRTGAWAIDGYIEDPGAGNIDVGHRTTILHPPTKKMGVGDVASIDGVYSANALWVFDDRVFDEAVEGGDLVAMRERARYVAWPPQGYIPADLVHPRWSFTKSDVDFSESEVRMFKLGGADGPIEISLDVIDRSGQPGHVPLPTLVWEPTIHLDEGVDTHYLVHIAGVMPTALGPGQSLRQPMPYAYVVKVLGQEPMQELTPAEFLARVDPRTRT